MSLFANVVDYIRRKNALRRLHKGWIQTEIRRRHMIPRPDCFAVLGIMKNEAHAIDEWVEHYLSVGAKRVFLIDNGSTDNTVERAQVWEKAGLVELVQYPEQHRQIDHYWKAFQEFDIAQRFDWLAIADLDEFWFCKSGETIPRLLERHPHTDVLVTNWAQFGSSGHLAQPQSLRLGFVMRDPILDRHTKCIFRTYIPVQPRTIRVHDVRRVRPSRMVVDNVSLQLNHYAIQSRDFWQNVKMKRGDVYYAEIDMEKFNARFDATDARATLEDCLLRDLVVTGKLSMPTGFSRIPVSVQESS